jgi:hypothetical protein
MKKIKSSSKEISVQPSSEKIGSFTEKAKRSIEIAQRIAEAYPMVGGTSSEDSMWRSLTSTSDRDLNQLTQRRMQDIAFYLYDSNPMAKRIVEIVRDFVVGDGFTFSAEDPEVKKVIEDFWNDPDNNLDSEIDVNVLEESIFGEICLPVWVNPVNGHVKLGYIDPKLILKVNKDQNNPKITKSVIWKKPHGEIERELEVINIDKKISSKSYTMLTGECFYFTVNKVSSASRGRSDLLCLADWLDGYDQFLFARLERAFLLNNFIWDIECDGMGKSEMEEFVKNLQIPRAGSIRAHNEKIKWNAVSPKLESNDASGEARLFKNQILGGAGYPEHWFAEGSNTTRATALEMGLPTLKKLKSRQRKTKFELMHIINFVIDQAILHKTLKKDVNRNFKIIPSPIVSRDNKGTAEAVNGLIDGLIKAKDNNWITDKKAKVVLNAVVSQIGVDMENDEQEPSEQEVTEQ